MGDLGAEPQCLAILGIYSQNNPFLGMFCLKTFEYLFIIIVT